MSQEDVEIVYRALSAMDDFDHVACRGVDLDQPFDSPTPGDPYADFEYVVLLGFEKHPDPEERYPAIDALGGVVAHRAPDHLGGARALATSGAARPEGPPGL